MNELIFSLSDCLQEIISQTHVSEINHLLTHLIERNAPDTCIFKSKTKDMINTIRKGTSDMSLDT